MLSKYRHFLLEALLDHYPLLDLTLPISNSVDTDCSYPKIILTLTFYRLILGTKCFLCVVWERENYLFSEDMAPLSLPVRHTKLSTVWVLKDYLVN